MSVGAGADITGTTGRFVAMMMSPLLVKGLIIKTTLNVKQGSMCQEKIVILNRGGEEFDSSFTAS